jgi:hydroxypyruvate reductase
MSAQSETKPEILIAAPLPAFLNDPLVATYTTHNYVGAADKEALLRDVGPRIRGLVCGGGTVLPTTMLDQLPKLEVISVFGVGYDGVPTDYCKSRGIKVGHTPNVLSDEVADLALSLMLMSARQLVAAQKYVEAGSWIKGNYPLVTSVHHKKVGIIGLGRIGLAIAKRCEGFSMQVSYHSRHARNDVPYPYYASLADMARDVNFLIAITPGGAGTKHLVNKAVLDALGKKGILINVARGSVVDTAALIAALDAGTLGGAGLDVFEDEPRVPDALFNRPNVVVLPHVASATHETRLAMGNLVLDNAAAHFAGKPLLALIPELQ